MNCPTHCQRERGSSLQCGFTLVELITIMVIIGIIGAIAAPRFFDNSTNNVFDSRGFRDAVISTLRYAQKSAIAQRRFVCVAFVSSPATVTLTYDTVAPSASHPTASCPGSALASPGGQASATVTSGKATFLTTPAAFSFDALGRASAAGSIQIVSTTVITVEAETGYVH